MKIAKIIILILVFQHICWTVSIVLDSFVIPGFVVVSGHVLVFEYLFNMLILIATLRFLRSNEFHWLNFILAFFLALKWANSVWGYIFSDYLLLGKISNNPLVREQIIKQGSQQEINILDLSALILIYLVVISFGLIFSYIALNRRKKNLKLVIMIIGLIFLFCTFYLFEFITLVNPNLFINLNLNPLILIFITIPFCFVIYSVLKGHRQRELNQVIWEQ